MKTMNGNLWLPDLFKDLMNGEIPNFKPCSTAPAINVMETEKSYIVELAAPGLKKEDFFVHINDEGNLVIKMEQKADKKEEKPNVHYLRREFSYTKYEQTLILPDDVEREKIGAKVNDGILTIDLPKIEENKVKLSRQINID